MYGKVPPKCCFCSAAVQWLLRRISKPLVLGSSPAARNALSRHRAVMSTVQKAEGVPGSGHRKKWEVRYLSLGAFSYRERLKCKCASLFNTVIPYLARWVRTWSPLQWWWGQQVAKGTVQRGREHMILY